MMKAYKAYDSRDCYWSEVIYAENANKAKSNAMWSDLFYDVEYIYIRVRRIPALDNYYRGRMFLNWYNAEDRIAMVKLGNYSCSEDYDCEMDECPAKDYCSRYEEMKEDEISC